MSLGNQLYKGFGMNIWGILKQYVSDVEVANNVKFSDSAWNRIKQLERDLIAVTDQQIGGLLVFDGKKYGTQFKVGQRVQLVSTARYGRNAGMGIIDQIGYDRDREQVMYQVILENGKRGAYSANELFLRD